MGKVAATVIAVLLIIGGVLLYRHRELLSLLGDGNSLIGATVATSSKECEGQFYGAEPAPLAVVFKNNGAVDALYIKWSVVGQMHGYSRSYPSVSVESDKILQPGESMTVCSPNGLPAPQEYSVNGYDFSVHIESVNWKSISL